MEFHLFFFLTYSQSQSAKEATPIRADTNLLQSLAQSAKEHEQATVDSGGKVKSAAEANALSVERSQKRRGIIEDEIEEGQGKRSKGNDDLPLGLPAASMEKEPAAKGEQKWGGQRKLQPLSTKKASVLEKADRLLDLMLAKYQKDE